MMKGNEEDGGSTLIEGRNEVIEALRSGRSIDRIYIQDGLHDGKLDTVRREAKKRGLRTDFVERKRLDDMSETGMHQGVIARAAAYAYAKVEDILEMALKKGEDPFIFLLDGIEDPHNLGAMIRTANVCGAHGVIIPKDRAVGLTPTVVRSSAGALNYTPVAKVTNLVRTMEDLKKRGLWFVGADMGGESMYEKDLKGPVGIVIGAEGRGLTKLVRDACDFVVSIPVKGEIESLNASVAAGVLAYEVTRQRTV
ncbi:MAG TPA: 23S rRNA (guanosine(2251)-2'-O)-methyltransferase RlmB [Lachnospiraceae bacterium]|nr:23S rRNA (guanosine(2251)-2'-O)-methyltransferase RlmB [Lachnospiraceae bacterium]